MLCCLVDVTLCLVAPPLVDHLTIFHVRPRFTTGPVLAIRRFFSQAPCAIAVQPAPPACSTQSPTPRTGVFSAFYYWPRPSNTPFLLFPQAPWAIVVQPAPPACSTHSQAPGLAIYTAPPRHNPCSTQAPLKPRSFSSNYYWSHPGSSLFLFQTLVTLHPALPVSPLSAHLRHHDRFPH